jgi:hypothetical protein
MINRGPFVKIGRISAAFLYTSRDWERLIAFSDLRSVTRWGCGQSAPSRTIGCAFHGLQIDQQMQRIRDTVYALSVYDPNETDAGQNFL